MHVCACLVVCAQVNLCVMRVFYCMRNNVLIPMDIRIFCLGWHLWGGLCHKVFTVPASWRKAAVTCDR